MFYVGLSNVILTALTEFLQKRNGNGRTATECWKLHETAKASSTLANIVAENGSYSRQGRRSTGTTTIVASVDEAKVSVQRGGS